MAAIQRHLSTNDGKDHQAQGIQYQKSFTQVIHQWGHHRRHHGSSGHNHDVFGMLDPTQRIMAEQDIAY